MAIELITGRAGTPHVDSADVGAFNASLFGGGAYILEGVNAELVDANNVNVSAGELLCEGRHIRITGAGETLTIDNGLSAYKRNDIIAAHYLRDEDGLESVQLVVIKGEATVDAPTDPAMPTTGKLLEGASDVYWPIFRITIDGLTPQTPVALAGRQAWYTLGLGTEIPAGADLNDYKTAGVYTIYAPNNIANLPAVDAIYGTLIVSETTSERGAGKIARQRYVNGEISQHVGSTWERSWTAWGGWGAWYCTGGIYSPIASGTSGDLKWVKYSNRSFHIFGRISVPQYIWGNGSAGWAGDYPLQGTMSIALPFAVSRIDSVVFSGGNWMGVPFTLDWYDATQVWVYVGSYGDPRGQGDMMTYRIEIWGEY